MNSTLRHHMDVLIDQLAAGQLSHKQALMQARKLATTPYNLEIQNFIAHRLWALGLQDEATEVHERAQKQAPAHTHGADEPFCRCELVRSGLSFQPLNFGVEAPAKVCDQGFDIAHLMLNREHHDALRHEVVD
jgi:hypothetical protein